MEVTRFESFAALPADAQQLAIRYRDVNPFVCDLWLKRFEEYLCGPEDELVYLVAGQGNRTHVVLPLVIVRHDKLPLRKLHSMANFYTTVFEPLLNADSNQLLAAQQLASYLYQTFKSVPLVEIEPLREAKFFALLAESFSNLSGQSARRYVKHLNRYERVEGDSYESYLARRPGKLRSTIKRKRKQLEKNTRSETGIFVSAKDIQREYPKFRQVYEESWKGQESYPEFIGAITADLADIGKAKLGILSVEGEPAAAQIWFRIGQAWGVFKLAYRPQFTQYSVGTLLTSAMIESFFDGEPITEIDFFSGDDAYKQDWVSECRDHCGLELIQPGNFFGRLLCIKRKFSAKQGS